MRRVATSIVMVSPSRTSPMGPPTYMQKSWVSRHRIQVVGGQPGDGGGAEAVLCGLDVPLDGRLYGLGMTPQGSLQGI
jgi:hypothetical protein